MQPSEIIDLFSKQASRAEKGLSTAKLSGNYQLLALNARQLFKAQLMQGLVRWRQGEDPSPLLELCIKDMQTNVELLAALDGNATIHVDLPIEKAMILAFLNNKTIAIKSDFANLDVPERRLDYLMASALLSGTITEGSRAEISKTIEALANRSDCDLVSRTYQTYFEILDKSFKNLPIEDSVKMAEELFARRANDSFYSGAEQTEGGGQDNRIVLDYRLAAILKKAQYVGDSIHCWR